MKSAIKVFSTIHKKKGQILSQQKVNALKLTMLGNLRYIIVLIKINAKDKSIDYAPTSY